MQNYREDLLMDFKDALIGEEFTPEQVVKISTIFILKLDKYEVSERSTEIATVDKSWFDYLRLYQGTLLTEGKSKKTALEYGALIKRFMLEVNKSINEIDVFTIRAWLAKEQQRVSLRSCENYRSYLSAFFQWLAREEFIEKNPMAKIKPIKYTDEVKLPFSEVEIDMMRSACKTLRERAMMEFFLASGVRASELEAINIDDVNFSTKEVVVRVAKGGKQRITYINDVCVEHLKRYLDSRKDDLPYLFITKMKTRVSKSISERSLKNLGERAGVKNVHPHRFRRTFATSNANKGMSIQTIKELMGHSNIDTTMMYITQSDKHLSNEYRKYN